MRHSFALPAILFILSFLLATTAKAEIFEPQDTPEQAFEERDFWPNGHEKEYRRIDSDGNVMGRAQYRDDGTLEKLEKFDKRGHKIAEARFDGSGKLDDSLDGWAAKRWLYKDGKLVFESLIENLTKKF